MTKTKALKEAVRLWGKQAGVQDGGTRCASTPEKRMAAREARMELRGLKGELKERPTRELRDFDDSLLFQSLRMRYSVGTFSEYGLPIFHVRGSGDSWEQAFAAAGRF